MCTLLSETGSETSLRPPFLCPSAVDDKNRTPRNRRRRPLLILGVAISPFFLLERSLSNRETTTLSPLLLHGRKQALKCYRAVVVAGFHFHSFLIVASPPPLMTGQKWSGFRHYYEEVAAAAAAEFSPEGEE